MKIYIASSWKNETAVRLLTEKLRAAGHEVLSFVENNYGEGDVAQKIGDFEEWVKTDAAHDAWLYDTDAATQSDLVIYLSPSGCDAWAEVGAAWGAGVPVFGLAAKGEQVGLMRKLVQWADSIEQLLDAVSAQAAGEREV